MVKKILLSLFIAVFIFFSAGTSQAKAQTWYSQEFWPWYAKTFDDNEPTEIFGERYTAAQVQWIVYSIPGHLLTAVAGGPDIWICLTSGDIGNCVEAASDALADFLGGIYDFFGMESPFGDANINPKTKNFALYDYFYNNQLSAVGMLLRAGSKFNLVPTANAQGFGFEFGANTVQMLWKVTRNITFGLVVLVVVAMAFMIMFRVKISPQAVVTIQSAIPKIIVGILLIAFSYAIAGLLIDLMYLVIGVISMIITNANLSNMATTELFLDLTDHRSAFVLSWQYVLDFIFGVIFTLLSASFFGGLLSILVLIVLIIATLFICFKIMWVLLKTYVNILLLIISAPFQMLIGMIPNSSGGFGSWLNSMIANLAVYPVVALLFWLAFFFLSQTLTWFDANGPEYNLMTRFLPFNPASGMLPGTTTWTPPLTAGAGTNSGRFLYLMVSFVIYMMIPKAANMVKSFMERKPFDMGMAIGEAIGPAKSIGTAGLGYFPEYMAGTPSGTRGPRGWMRKGYDKLGSYQNTFNEMLRTIAKKI